MSSPCRPHHGWRNGCRSPFRWRPSRCAWRGGSTICPPRAPRCSLLGRRHGPGARTGRAHPGAAPGRCAGRALPRVPGLLRTSGRRVGAVAPDAHGRPGHPARSDRRPSSENAGWISPQDVRRVACDAAVSRIITRGRSEPLELERQTAVVPTAVRRALILRDKRCPFPGSDRPHGWCDAHHVVALGRRRGELAFEPGAPVPKAPSGGSRGVRAPDDRRGAAVHAERRDDPQGSRRRTHVRIETTGVTLPRR